MLRMLKVSMAIVLFFSFCVVLAGDDNKSTKRIVDFNSETVTNIDIAPSLTPADTGFDNVVRAIGNYNGDLIVGGDFFNADGFSASRIVGWNGANWYSMNWFPLGNPIYDLLEFEGELYAAQFLGWLNSWDGSSWTQHEPPLGDGWGPHLALENYNNELIVGGSFTNDPSLPSFIAKWNGTGWDSVGTGINGGVGVLGLYDGALIAGGSFKTSDGSVSDRIAQWDGSTWSPLGSGISVGGMGALAIYNNELIAGGKFASAGGTAVNNIARWNGTIWQALGDGLDGTVDDLFVFENKLIAGGRFLNSGGTSTPYIASWDGVSWSPIGTGFDDDVYALGEYNGYLIAGGAFTTAGGHVALWDGAVWRPVSDIITDIGDDIVEQLPTGFSLDQNYPNPFNPSTVIEYNLPSRSHTKIEIYNINGQLVKLLVDQVMLAGNHTVNWDGSNLAGEKVSSGTYFYKLTTDDFTESKKMILLK